MSIKIEALVFEKNPKTCLGKIGLLREQAMYFAENLPIFNIDFVFNYDKFVKTHTSLDLSSCLPIGSPQFIRNWIEGAIPGSRETILKMNRFERRKDKPAIITFDDIKKMYRVEGNTKSNLVYKEDFDDFEGRILTDKNFASFVSESDVKFALFPHKRISAIADFISVQGLCEVITTEILDRVDLSTMEKLDALYVKDSKDYLFTRACLDEENNWYIEQDLNPIFGPFFNFSYYFDIYEKSYCSLIDYLEAKEKEEKLKTKEIPYFGYGNEDDYGGWYY